MCWSGVLQRVPPASGVPACAMGCEGSDGPASVLQKAAHDMSVD
ncbi:hypothetical protein trd_A0586 (plasmid) [Thermomicrobium roseum DSM 5159]|uniref:Uncharacterized protein n=1 Tax=Thermomicrobium roseum (strain ATCC 27502 / DSM 5159 / P-2) TaxID=309801 RepID=B9L472_THERP|nr:hypothetical protein trd_A0586 [Thermomicrobium roseum DSM 5159]